MSRRRIILGWIVTIAATGMLVGGVEKGRLQPEVPEELTRWSFLIGDWRLDSKRYSFEGDVIEDNAGTARFSPTLGGLRIQELQSVTFAGRQMEVLNLFAFDPDDNRWEVARTDSVHTTFGVARGEGSGDRIVLFERDPRPDSDVRRRWTYTRLGRDSFTVLLEFSFDEGESWLRRNETLYERRPRTTMD